jgi:hypothetical protein
VNALQIALPSLQASTQLQRGHVAEWTEDGRILVSLETNDSGEVPRKLLCDFLRTSDSDVLQLDLGDQVLVWLPAHSQQFGCVLGKVGAYRPPNHDHVEIRADKELTLRSGHASLTLRSDGKMLTKAVDIATIAKRTHRLRGGSIQIN